MIPYGRQEITKSDVDAVIEVLQSDFLTQGPKVPLFESTVTGKVGANYALAVNSATSALHIACLSLDLSSGDRLWTTPISFVASANCGYYCGAVIDFVDIDPNTYNLCPKLLEKKLIVAERENLLPKILVVVHFSGQPCDLKPINKLSKRYGFKVIEDASHAIGGKYHNEYIGNCKYSEITIFSFHPVKIITTAEGGVALTNSKKLAEKMNLFRSHGITRDPKMMTQSSDGPWYYQQIELGYNYRMTDLQAALGISQIKRLDSYIVRRNELAERYNTLLDNLPVITPFQLSKTSSAYHLYIIRLKLDLIRKSHLTVFKELRAAGIGVNLHYIPIYRQPYFSSKGFDPQDYPQSEKYYQEAITLPIFQSLTNGEQDLVVNILSEVLEV